MLKKKLLFIVILFLFNTTNFIFAEIIPIKKPIQTKEEKEKKLLKDIVKPLPKPLIVKETIKKDKNVDKKK